MSDMEFFYGKVRESTRTDVPNIEDDDDYYDWEDQQDGKMYFRVNGGILYEVTPVDCSMNVYGGTMTFNQDFRYTPHIMCHWYNGGASKREVIEKAVKDLFE